MPVVAPIATVVIAGRSAMTNVRGRMVLSATVLSILNVKDLAGGRFVNDLNWPANNWNDG
jgi:hypothetical protein